MAPRDHYATLRVTTDSQPNSPKRILGLITQPPAPLQWTWFLSVRGQVSSCEPSYLTVPQLPATEDHAPPPAPPRLLSFHLPSPPPHLLPLPFLHQEMIQIYGWALKDISWAQGALWLNLLLGIIGILWAIRIVYVLGVQLRLRRETLHAVVLALWLIGNAIWAFGENWDYTFHGQPGAVYAQHTVWCRYLMVGGVVMLSFYYIVIRPWRLWDEDLHTEMDEEFSQGKTAQRPRFTFYFRNLREYENAHVLFWLLKGTIKIHIIRQLSRISPTLSSSHPVTHTRTQNSHANTKIWAGTWTIRDYGCPGRSSRPRGPFCICTTRFGPPDRRA